MKNSEEEGVRPQEMAVFLSSFQQGTNSLDHAQGTPVPSTVPSSSLLLHGPTGQHLLL